jgi:hypothetical protein
MPEADSVAGEDIPSCVKYIEWGLADYVEDTIYLNKGLRLKRWKRLHDELLAHEQQHQKGNHLKADMKPTSMAVNVDGVRFMLTHPKTVAQFSPFRFYPDKRKLYFDRSLLATYLGMFFVAVIVWTLF